MRISRVAAMAITKCDSGIRATSGYHNAPTAHGIWKFILTVRRTTTGDALWRHKSSCYGPELWELKLRLSERLHVSSPFALRMLQGAVELDDTQRLGAYVHSGWK